jgi:hypothetical protein
MSRAFITNMNHFLDEKGAIPPTIPKKSRKFAENLGHIVACVTSQPGSEPRTVVHCWNKINRKPCPGKISAEIDLERLDIIWYCLKCGDHGSISGWEHTFWDGKYR